MNHLVTFSDASMEHSAVACISSALSHGVEEYRYLTPELLRCWAAVEANPEVFRQPEDPRRAWGWWAFKPLIIEHSTRLLKDGDVLIYSDAGVEFIDNVSHIIERMDQDIFLFGNQWEHAHWCKWDTIDDILTGTLLPCSRLMINGKQCQASVIFFRVSDYTRAFVQEWLHWCLFEGGRLIDDSPSRAPNHPEFQEHRHDQAILTTMAYRDGIKLHWWPARYNMDQPGGGFVYPKDGYEADDYPAIVHHHRRRNHEWQQVA